MSIPALLADTAFFLAQTTGPIVPASQPAAAEAPAWAQFIQRMGFIPLFVVLGLFLWMSSRSKKKQEKEKKSMLSAMKRGDRIQTIGGILGNVVETKEDRILVKVDESNNTKVWFARSAIHRVLGEETDVK